MELRYGTGANASALPASPFPPSDERLEAMVAFLERHAKTSPRLERDRLMFCVSCRRLPSAPERESRSLLIARKEEATAATTKNEHHENAMHTVTVGTIIGGIYRKPSGNARVGKRRGKREPTCTKRGGSRKDPITLPSGPTK